MARAPEVPLLAAVFIAVGSRNGMPRLEAAVERFARDVGVPAEALIGTRGDGDRIAEVLEGATSGSPAVDAAIPILLSPAVILLVQGWTEAGAARLSRAINDFADACEAPAALHEPDDGDMPQFGLLA